MTTTTMQLRCDWCYQPATYQLQYRGQFDHKLRGCDACADHRGLPIRLLAEFGGQITTMTGERWQWSEPPSSRTLYRPRRRTAAARSSN
jgi:hypothetical protein